MKEGYRGVHIAIPLPQDLYPSWAWQLMFAIEYGRFPELKKDTPYPHVTLYYLGGINEETFKRVEDLISHHSKNVIGTPLQTTGLKILGESKKALVVGIKNTAEMQSFRNEMEIALPEYSSQNLPLSPHLTVTELSVSRSIRRAKKLVVKSLTKSLSNEPFFVEKVGLYHKQSEIG